jgi:hypothetical protein
MKQIIFIAAVAMLVLAVGAGETQAQGQKASKKCPANFYELCLKRCSASGGRASYCPQYCTSEQTKRC